MNTLISERTPAMTPEQMQEIPMSTITADQIKEQISCAVCLTDFQLNEVSVRKLLCNHFFHENCIFPWLRNNASCPVCRQRLPNANSNANEVFENDEDIGEHCITKV
jgi:E3 ubiquitin-protein ligase RNF115/126